MWKRGLDLLCEAWARAAPDLRLTIGGCDRETGVAWLARRGIAEPPGVEWAGALPREEWLGRVARARVFVNASRREDHGLAQLEALAVGTPLVTVPSPGAYEALPIARRLAPELVAARRVGARARDRAACGARLRRPQLRQSRGCRARAVPAGTGARRRPRRGAAGARPVMTTLGTAGHIDHGKTALIKALTGVDTDRLPEERERGISIALGYAPLALPSGRRLSVIDVPGHQRFVRTMVAGATGIDLYLMVVAADDGVMPQTREHATVLRALGVEVGVVAVTKADLADPARARAEAGELLPGAEVVAVSARTGEGSTSCVPRSTARRTAPRRGPTLPVRCACTSTACSRSAAPARSSPARCGRAARGAATP